MAGPRSPGSGGPSGRGRRRPPVNAPPRDHADAHDESADMAQLDPFTIDVLGNNEVLSVSQDELGRPIGRRRRIVSAGELCRQDLPGRLWPRLAAWDS